jgi:hypothetical protein
MTTNKEKIESLKKAMNVLNEQYYFSNDNNKVLKGKIAQAYDTLKYISNLMTKREEGANLIQAQIKFRMPNGKDKYVNKTFNDKKHMRAYIDKVCKQEDCDLDEVWY